MKFQCSVLRTHHLGERRRDNDPGQPVVGTVHMYSILHKGLNRHVERMSMDALAKFGARVPSAIPDLLEPQLLTFSSDRGMMVCGFEEIAGVRYYQGWWMQWVDERQVP
ncbi:hypothetical protein [Achromobacter xylosoxidans]|uniref:hypothetical protein n=2 Tax=Alcaligenes xylosoxydans xylosoxydans TaxID=85698 RepID=UPI001F134CF4|nr:hypothetical protein [Achromobacter xylosoxidans]MCZ8437213.1 hypothetical protein [Achromobacter xylosoxidans]MDZ5686845.1 hypothetical protein [Achromobacter xylosoxidans]